MPESDANGQPVTINDKKRKTILTSQNITFFKKKKYTKSFQMEKINYCDFFIGIIPV